MKRNDHSGWMFVLLAGLLCAVVPMAALAQSTLDFPMGEKLDYRLDSGMQLNRGSQLEVVYADAVSIADAVWVRLYFDQVDLAAGSFIRVTSAWDGEVQELDAKGLAMWNNTTAYFNGDTVSLELLAAPGTSNHVVLGQAGVHVVPGRGPCADADCGICGVDNRSLSTELWTGRIVPVGCTGSIISTDSCVVSAGHCVGSDDTLQFNVPASSSNCGTYNPPVADQFPITNRQYVNGGVGNDWAVMTVGTNNLGQTPYERYGQMRPVAVALANANDPCDNWGYGVDNDNPTRSQVQQTHSGDVLARYSDHYTFDLDMTYGNSGSALLKNGEIIGILTHCSFSCLNYATRIDLAAFAAARASLCGGGGGGYCSASSASTSYEHISRVQVGSIDNSSGATAYSDYTAQSTDMNIGTGYGLTVTIGTPYASDVGGAWADWNQDEDFSDVGETITTAWSGNGPYTVTVTPPAGALTGATRMRVRIQDGSYDPTLSPCGTTSYGEVEDYTINVVDVVPPTDTVSATYACVPDTGSLPFTTTMFVTLDNLYTGFTRTISGRININLASTAYIGGWRVGFTNVAAGGSYNSSWNTNLPAYGALVGVNTFTLVAMDTTATPYNQPPYPPAGDTASDACLITATAK